MREGQNLSSYPKSSNSGLLQKPILEENWIADKDIETKRALDLGQEAQWTLRAQARG